MKSTGGEREQARKVKTRLHMIQHYEQLTDNVSQTCRFFAISPTQFYTWLNRYRAEGVAGLWDRPCGPRVSPWQILQTVQALILQVRQERQYGAVRLSYFLARYHQVYVSPPTIHRVLKAHRVPPVSLKSYRPAPRRRQEIRIPGQSVQVDVKYLKLRQGRLYQFTAIDKATRYRVLKIYEHSSIASAIDFVDEVRRRLPVAIQRIKTGHGSEFGTDFTWHLHDLGIAHRHIPPRCPESNGKEERSHRTDADEFYRRVTFRTSEELRAKLRAWEHEYNHRRPHLALRGKTPAEQLCKLRTSARSPIPRSAEARHAERRA